MATPLILTHGGAGAPDEWSDGCQVAAAAASAVLKAGDPLAAVVTAARILEDDERFNAGTGSRLRLDGSCQMDASVMDSEGRYGAVAAIHGLRHPIDAARLVLDSPHSILAGSGATEFARAKGLPPESCVTAAALSKLAKSQAALRSGELRPTDGAWQQGMEEFKGTIGAVARSADGRFAVSCSTGGTSLMLPGRVGDSPIIGAGVFCGPLGAICCTGHGEQILARLVAHRVYLALEAGAALAEVCQAEIDAFPADFSLGIIALSKDQDWAGATGSMARSRDPDA